MNKIIKRPSLLSNLSDIHQAIDRIFEPTGSSNENFLQNIIDSNWSPSVDVKDEKDKYVIRADIPGVDPKNIDVTIDQGMLVIKGHKESESKEERDNYVHIERSQGSFFRSLKLPYASDASKITAKTKNGVLEITVPKNHGQSGQKVRIQSE